MRRKIPSTGMLVAFEAAARHGSFTKAAQELSLTQSAVCRQVASLEAFLGVALFRRVRQGVRLTEVGLAYGRQVASRLDEVERDTLAIMARREDGNALELAVLPTFGTRWLLPRLARRPGVHDFSLNLTTRTRPFLFADTEFDAAIHFGMPDWPGTEAHFLMAEKAVPVASPRVRARLGPGKRVRPESLARLPLLQQTTRPYAWRQWFEAQDVRAAHDLNGPRFELFSMLAAAAMHDMGVALVPPFLVQDELASGRLVVLCDWSAPSEKAYYLVIPRTRTPSVALQRFRDWLLAEAAAYRAD